MRMVLAIVHLLAGLFFATAGIGVAVGVEGRFEFLAAMLFASAATGLTLACVLLAHPNAPRTLMVVLIVILHISMTLAFISANEVVAWEREMDSWGLAELAARLVQIVAAVTAVVSLLTLAQPRETREVNDLAR